MALNGRAEEDTVLELVSFVFMFSATCILCFYFERSCFFVVFIHLFFAFRFRSNPVPRHGERVKQRKAPAPYFTDYFTNCKILRFV